VVTPDEAKDVRFSVCTSLIVGEIAEVAANSVAFRVLPVPDSVTALVLDSVAAWPVAPAKV